MFKSLSLSIAALLLFVTNTKSSDSDVIEAYIDLSDCGDGSLVDFSLSITPYPVLLIVSSIYLWVGGQVSFTEAAEKIARNTTYEPFHSGLRQLFFVDYTSIPIPEWISNITLRPSNNTHACGGMLDPKMCEFIFNGMNTAKQNAPLFLGMELNAEHANMVFSQFVRWLLSNTLEVQLRMKLVHSDHEEIMCLQLNMRSRKSDYDVTPNSLAYYNLQQSFATPKFMNMRKNKTLECPSNSSELTNSTCNCTPPHSGPFCQFQCNLGQMGAVSEFCMDISNICIFIFGPPDYAESCINDRHIPVLKEKVAVSAPNLSSVHVSWRTENFFTLYSFTLTLKTKILNDDGVTGQYFLYSDMDMHLDGVPKEITLTRMNQNGESTELHLSPFTNYTLSLTYVIESENHVTKYVAAGSTNFMSPETLPRPPRIVNAALFSKDIVLIDWILVSFCPGLITKFSAEIWCDEDSSGNHSTNGTFVTPFDCRSRFNSTNQLRANVPTNCASNNLEMHMSENHFPSTADYY